MERSAYVATQDVVYLLTHVLMLVAHLQPRPDLNELQTRIDFTQAVEPAIVIIDLAILSARMKRQWVQVDNQSEGSSGMETHHR